jgi:serralysin
MPTNSGVTSSALSTIYFDAVQAYMPAGIDIWNTSSKPPLTFTYEFVTAQPLDATTFSGWTAFTAAQKAVIRSVLTEYASFINVRFVESTGSNPDICFGRVTLSGSEGGVGGYRVAYTTDYLGRITSRSLDSFALFDRLDAITRYAAPHEIGHAMTLKHPGNYDAGGGAAPGPYLPASLDSNKFTVMSYAADPDNHARSSHLMLLDIAALQARFGANLHWHTGDNVYSKPVGAIQVIWDAGGTDMINAGGYFTSVKIDLRAGFFSSLGASDNLAIAYRVVIENANGGSAGDSVTGNQWNNHLFGGGGNDLLSGRGGVDTLTGGAGADRFVFNTALNPVTNVDTITDFAHHGDLIVLENAVFTALPVVGTLSPNAFSTGAAAHDRDDRIIYNVETGALSYDANGSGVGGAVHFAWLAHGLNLSAADFLVA